MFRTSIQLAKINCTNFLREKKERNEERGGADSCKWGEFEAQAEHVRR